MQQFEVFGTRLPGQRDDWLFIGGSALVILIFGALLFWDFNRKNFGGGGEVIGTITFKHRTAQRKFASQVIWDDLDTETPLYNRDAIRTAESSEAVVTLKNGTKIQLDESTMIVLNISDKSADIDFAYGSVQAKQDQKAGQEVAALNIKTQDNKVISIQNSDVKLSRNEGEDLSLTVQRGQANVQTSDGKTQKVEKDQKATIAAEIQVRKVVLRPTAPDDGARSFITENQKAFAFAWEKPTEALTFEIASDRSFSRIITRVTTAGPGTSVALGDGSYFWRLAAQDKTGKIDYSDFRRFTVIRNAPAVLLSPVSGAQFDYVTDDPLVNFTWSRSETAQGYALEIAENPGFAGARRIETSTTSISQKLPAGNYFARIVTTSSEAGNLPGAATAFTVVRRQKTQAPLAVRPAGDRIARVILEKEGLAFSWSVDRDVRSTTLEISPNASFDQIAFKGTADTNFLTVKQGFREGKYYWRLQGIDRKGNATDFSNVSSFTVAEMEKVALRGPVNGADMDPVQARLEGVGLLWEGPDLSQFRVVVSPNQNLDPAVVNQMTSARAYSARNLAPGRYYWKVLLVSQNGSVLTESEIRSFSILDLLQPPRLLEPPRGQTVDMTDKNELYFKWDPVRGAEGYDFTLFRSYPDGRRTAILNLKTQRADFMLRDLGILDVGGFTWSVSAYGRNQVSEPAASDFTITLRIDVGKPEIVTPGVQYTE